VLVCLGREHTPDKALPPSSSPSSFSSRPAKPGLALCAREAVLGWRCARARLLWARAVCA
jgi:hypothetical protein